MIKQELVYADSKDLHVCKVVLYAHSDNVLYYDAEHTTSVSHEELMDLLKKGLVLVFNEDTYHYPVFFKDEGAEVKVTVATSIGTGTSTSAEYKSKERTEE